VIFKVTALQIKHTKSQIQRIVTVVHSRFSGAQTCFCPHSRSAELLHSSTLLLAKLVTRAAEPGEVMRVGDCMNKKLERKDYKVETWRDAGTSQCTFACVCHMRRIPVFQEAFLRSLYYRIGTWFGLGSVRPARQSQTNTPPSTNTFLQFSRHSDDECSSACFVPGSVWHSIRSFPMPEVEVPL